MTYKNNYMNNSEYDSDPNTTWEDLIEYDSGSEYDSEPEYDLYDGNAENLDSRTVVPEKINRPIAPLAPPIVQLASLDNTFQTLKEVKDNYISKTEDLMVQQDRKIMRESVKKIETAIELDRIVASLPTESRGGKKKRMEKEAEAALKDNNFAKSADIYRQLRRHVEDSESKNKYSILIGEIDFKGRVYKRNIMKKKGSTNTFPHRRNGGGKKRSHVETSMVAIAKARAARRKKTKEDKKTAEEARQDAFKTNPVVQIVEEETNYFSDEETTEEQKEEEKQQNEIQRVMILEKIKIKEIQEEVAKVAALKKRKVDVEKKKDVSMWQKVKKAKKHMPLLGSVGFSDGRGRDRLGSVACHRGRRCRKNGCPYNHDSDVAQDVRMCKNGDNCRFHKMGKCSFKHENSPSVVPSTPVILMCKNGDNCRFHKMGRCTYKHATKTPPKAPEKTLPPLPPLPAPSLPKIVHFDYASAASHGVVKVFNPPPPPPPPPLPPPPVQRPFVQVQRRINRGPSMCRNGANCRWHRNGTCTFKHTSAPQKIMTCRFWQSGQTCMHRNCRFKHSN
jgi:hypothetical protein